MINGRIIEEQKNYYIVDTPNGHIRASLRGTMRKKKHCVGDTVEVEITNVDSREGIINRVCPRKNFIPRPPLANMDQCIAMATVRAPAFDKETFDRLLVIAEMQAVTPLIVFNKVETLDTQGRTELDEYSRIFSEIGYTVVLVSAATGLNIDTIIAACTGKSSFLVGASGVGKTTLLARLFPDLEFRTAPLSAHNNRGVHTTTSTSLLTLPGGGYLADTPGFSYIELPVVSHNTIKSYFPEIARQQGACRFNDCMHENEPGCAVKDMVAASQIASFRYEHYLKFSREMKMHSKSY